jgi:hypothetical protein
MTKITGLNTKRRTATVDPTTDIGTKTPTDQTITVLAQPKTVTPNKTTKLKRKQILPTNQDNVNVTTTHTKLNQQLLGNYYDHLKWYNSPIYHHNSVLDQLANDIEAYQSTKSQSSPFQTLTMANTPTNPTILTHDDYLIVASQVSRQTGIIMDSTAIASINYRLQQYRSGNTSPNDHKRQKLQNSVITANDYIQIASDLQAYLGMGGITGEIITIVDLNIRNFSQVNRIVHVQTLLTRYKGEVNNPSQTPISQTRSETAALHDRNFHNNTLPPKQLFEKHEETQGNDDDEVQHVEQSDLKPAAIYVVSIYPKTKFNRSITNTSFVTTAAAHFPQPTVIPTDLICTFEENPRATFEVAMKLLDCEVPKLKLQTMFNKDYTIKTTPIHSVLEMNKMGEHFQFRNYKTSVAANGKTQGIFQLLLGASGDNFTGENPLPTEHPILCQVTMKAKQKEEEKVNAQWMLFFPTMNTIVTCGNEQKQVWAIGKDTHKAIKAKDWDTSTRRVGKMIFPKCDDRVKDIQLLSAVFIAPLNANFDFN